MSEIEPLFDSPEGHGVWSESRVAPGLRVGDGTSHPPPSPPIFGESANERYERWFPVLGGEMPDV